MTEKVVYKIYVPATGGVHIAAQEIKRKDGISIRVRNPAFVSTNQNGVGFVFQPLPYSLDEFEMHWPAVFGSQDMPELMTPWYEKWVKVQTEQRKLAP